LPCFPCRNVIAFHNYNEIKWLLMSSPFISFISFFFLVLYMITILSQDVLLKIFLKFKYDEILKVFLNDDMKFVLMCNDFLELILYI
jgi:hypothetical protein